jgi:hypothetical protein
MYRLICAILPHQKTIPPDHPQLQLMLQLFTAPAPETQPILNKDHNNPNQHRYLVCWAISGVLDDLWRVCCNAVTINRPPNDYFCNNTGNQSSRRR